MKRPHGWLLPLLGCGATVGPGSSPDGDAGLQYPAECRNADGSCAERCWFGANHVDLRNKCRDGVKNVFCHPPLPPDSGDCPGPLDCWIRTDTPDDGLFLTCVLTFSGHWRACTKAEIEAATGYDYCPSKFWERAKPYPP